MSDAEYIRVVRSNLPAEAFSPNPRAYFLIMFHVGVVVAGWFATLLTSRPWWLLIAIPVAVSMSALTFLAHDLSHRTITTNRYLLYPTELVVWSLLYLPPTLWRKVHGIHHAHTNDSGDPDRRFLASEMGQRSIIAAALLFPNKTMRYLPIYLLYWLLFPFRHGISALFYRSQSLPPFATAKPRYSTQDKLWIVFEIFVIVAVQLAIGKLVGFGRAFFCVSLFPVLCASVVVSWYFFTNHGLKPIGEGKDVLATTTTVTVPKLCDKLHSNFSYHVEHHLFPTMNPKYYPMVSKLFRKYFPDRYHCVPIGKAWTVLFRSSIACADRAAPSISEPDRTTMSPGVTVSTQPALSN